MQAPASSLGSGSRYIQVFIWWEQNERLHRLCSENIVRVLTRFSQQSTIDCENKHLLCEIDMA